MPPPTSVAPAAPNRDASIKGVAVREFVRWYERRVGPARFQALVSGLPAIARDAFDLSAPGLGIVSTTWYPAGAVNALLDAIEQQIEPKDRERVTLEAARAVMDVTLSGVYRVLFRMMASPERYARYCQKLWSTYYDSGRIEIVLSQEGTTAVTTTSGWTAHHPLSCDLNRGASVAIFLAMGCRNVSCVREACVVQGAPACRFVTRWTG